MSVNPTDLLVAIARQRDRAAFAETFRLFAPKVKMFLLSRGVAADTADELVQEIMLAVWRRAETFDPERGPARAWIFAIARNCLVDRVRASRRHEVEPDDPARVVEAPSCEAEFLAREDQAALTSAIGSLPEEQSDVLRGAYFRGRSFKELASEMQVPLGTVKTRMRLALQRLRGLLRAQEKTT